MSDNEKYRELDGGRPLLIEEHDPPGLCGHGVCVETHFEGRRDELTLLLRHAERHNGGPAHACGDRVVVALSLTTGQCAARDPLAETFLTERPWFAAALLRRLDWLRGRARREAAQQDRRSASFAFLDRTERGIMVPYDRLFPDDWDLLFQHDGHYLWAVDLHCSNPDCACADVLIQIRDCESEDASLVGKIEIKMNDTKPRPVASPPTAAKAFKALWEKHGNELKRRHAEVRQIVAEHAARRASSAVTVQPPSTPTRNGLCPCGSGRKYKRCCAGRELQPSRSGSGAGA